MEQNDLNHVVQAEKALKAADTKLWDGVCTVGIFGMIILFFGMFSATCLYVGGTLCVSAFITNGARKRALATLREKLFPTPSEA